MAREGSQKILYSTFTCPEEVLKNDKKIWNESE